MDISTLNKMIRNYSGDNSFIISLCKQLKNKYVKKVEINGKMVSSLSESQYKVAKSILIKEGLLSE